MAKAQIPSAAPKSCDTKAQSTGTRNRRFALGCALFCLSRLGAGTPRLKSLNRKVICAMSFLGSAAGPALGLSSPLHLLPGLPSNVPGAPFQLQQLHPRGRKEVPGQKEDTSLDRENFQGGRLDFFPLLLCLRSRLSCEEDPPCNKFNMAKRQKVPASCFSNAEQTLKKMGREM